MKTTKPKLDLLDASELIAGVDEAGRGPLAGPVLAAAVILHPKRPILGLKDSKKLTPSKREELFEQIRANAYAFAIGRASVAEIDDLNILQASLLAMSRALARLSVIPSLALIDGNRLPLILPCEGKAIIGGDDSEPAISAASILAKVCRDRFMQILDKKYPQYGFGAHKGYGTAIHIKAINEHGATRIHRRSFAPVAKALTL